MRSSRTLFGPALFGSALAVALLGSAPAWAQSPAPAPAPKPGGSFTTLEAQPNVAEPQPPPPAAPGARGAKPAPRYRKSDNDRDDALYVKGDDVDDVGAPEFAMDRWTAREMQSRVGVEFDVWSADSGSSLVWVPGAHVGDMESFWRVDIDLPFTYLTTPDTTLPIIGTLRDGVSQVQFGNPVVGAHIGGKIHERVTLWGGFAIAIPTLLDEGDAVEYTAHGVASLVRAGYDQHRFAPGYVPIIERLGVEAQLHRFVYLRYDLGMLQYAPAVDAFSFAGTLQQALEAEALSVYGLGGGVRLQGAFLLFRDGGFNDAADRAQMAMEPYAVYAPPRTGPHTTNFYARLGLLIALDETLGFGFDTNKVATLRTALGYQF